MVAAKEFTGGLSDSEGRYSLDLGLLLGINFFLGLVLWG